LRRTHETAAIVPAALLISAVFAAFMEQHVAFAIMADKTTAYTDKIDTPS
jgi:hypothetical protein